MALGVTIDNREVEVFLFIMSTPYMSNQKHCRPTYFVAPPTEMRPHPSMKVKQMDSQIVNGTGYVYKVTVWARYFPRS